MNRVLVIHRKYRVEGGEESFLNQLLLPQLQKIGLEVEEKILPPLDLKKNFIPSFLELLFMVLGLEKLRPSYRNIKKSMTGKSYSAVVFNAFLPTISLDIPRWIKSKSIPTIAWSHNGRYSCANGLYFNGKNKCDDCFTKSSLNALRYKCFSSSLQTVLYALTYRNRRVPKKILPSIDHWISSSHYSENNLTRVFRNIGIEAKTSVIYMQPKATSSPTLPPTDLRKTLVQYLEKNHRSYFLFLGRLSFEKGIDQFLELAKKYPNHQFVVAGHGPLASTVETINLKNLFYLGHVTQEEKETLFHSAKALILCSRVPENSPMVILESHPHQLPIVFPSGGGAEELLKYLQRTAVPFESFDPNQELPRVSKDISQNQFSDDIKKELSSYLKNPRN